MTDEQINLPPLPEPFDPYRRLFVPTQIEDYARAAILADRAARAAAPAPKRRLPAGEVDAAPAICETKSPKLQDGSYWHAAPAEIERLEAELTSTQSEARTLKQCYIEEQTETAHWKSVAQRAEAELEEAGRYALKTTIEWRHELATLRQERDALQKRVEQLEWENKGIEEWRDVAMRAFDKVKVLEAMVRDLCMGHPDKCDCRFCKAVFRVDTEPKEKA